MISKRKGRWSGSRMGRPKEDGKDDGERKAMN